jgi:hypothetical protein
MLLEAPRYDFGWQTTEVGLGFPSFDYLDEQPAAATAAASGR